VRRLSRATPIGLLSDSYLLDTAAALRAADARDWWPHWRLVDAALVAAVHGAGGRVIAWTVNDPDAARRLAALGVDGICTDVPDVVGPAIAHVPRAAGASPVVTPAGAR
jgi:glycerophosphoryl diester phosphodiesterase